MRLSNSVKHNSSLSENWAGVSKDPQETIVFLTKSPKVKLSDFPPDFPRLQKGTPRFFRHGDLQYLPRGGEFAGELSRPGPLGNGEDQRCGTLLDPLNCRVP